MGLGLDPSSGMGLLRNLGAGRGPPADFFMSAVCAPKPLGSAGTLGKAGDCGIKLPRDACHCCCLPAECSVGQASVLPSASVGFCERDRHRAGSPCPQSVHYFLSAKIECLISSNEGVYFTSLFQGTQSAVVGATVRTGDWLHYIYS